MIPATAPDEAMFLEEGNEQYGNPISIANDTACAILMPVPIVGIANINIHQPNKRDCGVGRFLGQAKSKPKDFVGILAFSFTLNAHRKLQKIIA